MRTIFKMSSNVPQLNNVVSSNMPSSCDDLNHHLKTYLSLNTQLQESHDFVFSLTKSVPVPYWICYASHCISLCVFTALWLKEARYSRVPIEIALQVNEFSMLTVLVEVHFMLKSRWRGIFVMEIPTIWAGECSEVTRSTVICLL